MSTSLCVSLIIANVTILIEIVLVCEFIAPISIIIVLPLYQFGFVTLSSSSSPRLSFAQSRKLNIALLGLGVSRASATVVLNVKNLAGVPRLDFFERCQLDVDKIAAYTVGGGYGQSLSDRWVLVTREICRAYWSEITEGLRTFPSSYATIAFAGLWYLTLYLRASSRLIRPESQPWNSSTTGSSGNTNGRLQSNDSEVNSDRGVLLDLPNAPRLRKHH